MSGIVGNLNPKSGLLGNPNGTMVFLAIKDSFSGAEDTDHLVGSTNLTRYDPLGGWDTSSDKYTVQDPGWYHFCCDWESYDQANNTGGVRTKITKNGSTLHERYNYIKYSNSGWVYDSMRHFGAKGETSCNASAGDYFQWYLWFKTGNGSDNWMSHIRMTIFKANK